MRLMQLLSVIILLFIYSCSGAVGISSSIPAEGGVVSVSDASAITGDGLSVKPALTLYDFDYDLLEFDLNGIAISGGYPVNGLVAVIHGGVVTSLSFYLDGVLNGMSKEFYPDGTIFKECYYKHGLLEGIEKKYRFDGEVFSITNFEGGVLNGVSAFETFSGWVKVVYKDGVPVVSDF